MMKWQKTGAHEWRAEGLVITREPNAPPDAPNYLLSFDDENYSPPAYFYRLQPAKDFGEAILDGRARPGTDWMAFATDYLAFDRGELTRQEFQARHAPELKSLT